MCEILLCYVVKHCKILYCCKIIVNEIFYYSEISLDSLKCKFKLMINDIDEVPLLIIIFSCENFVSLFIVYDS